MYVIKGENERWVRAVKRFVGDVKSMKTLKLLKIYYPNLIIPHEI